MPRINLTLAACLIGRSDKFVRALCEAEKIPGASKVSAPGEPAQWDMDMAEFYAAAASLRLISPERLRLLATWLDLAPGILHAPAPAATGSAPVPAAIPEPSGIFREPSGRMPGTFRTRADAARWLQLHGVKSASTPKDWLPDWLEVRLDPESVLRLAKARCDTSNHRVTWRLHWCHDPACICRTLLDN